MKNNSQEKGHPVACGFAMGLIAAGISLLWMALHQSKYTFLLFGAFSVPWWVWLDFGYFLFGGLIIGWIVYKKVDWEKAIDYLTWIK